ncbi:LolA family protein [Nostoc sp. 'Peltigera membranacea cyanobiont' 232]|uniref:LolA family protein n=1 Tax=Nostoc sp. 'Peltigera membranacea cyanobiont' 232 TaxID=2014531 RepID=UPI000B95A9A7|nr:hypothetical protein [Nostoc sp. 'Peltigera membranacea cyanobiont' 232]
MKFSSKVLAVLTSTFGLFSINFAVSLPAIASVTCESGTISNYSNGSLASCILGQDTTVQVSGLSSPPASSRIVIASKGTNISQAQEKLDLELLARAITAFLQSDRYLTESESLVSIKKDGFDLNFQVQTKTLAESDGKFRSEITFIQPGGKTKLYTLVICDGKQVWIYKSELQQYAIISYAAFKEELLFIGLSSLVFLEAPENTRKLIVQSKSSSEIVQEFGLANDSGLQEEKRTIDGEEFSAYNYTHAKDGFTLSGLVQPATATLKQMQMGGNSDGLNILVTEKIIQRTANPTINAETFKFLPPPGAKKVKSLSISPF